MSKIPLNMSRSDLFTAIRPFAPDKRFNADHIAAIDSLADAFGLARVDGGVTAMIDVTLLKLACPERSTTDLLPWVAPIQEACLKYDISNIRRVAAFISQMAHESGLVAGIQENMNYSAKRLTEVWPSRFPTIAAATPYANNPQKLANKVYANRMGNGDEASGDGWRFRATGPGLTGRDNWTRFGKAIGKSAEDAIAYALTVAGGVASFAWFWSVNGLNALADTPSINDETLKINGGTIGLADRKARFDRVVTELLRRGA